MDILQRIITASLRSAHALRSYTVYDDVLKAQRDPSYARLLNKRFTEQRKMVLVILAAVLAYVIPCITISPAPSTEINLGPSVTVQQDRLTSSIIVISCILLTSNISLMYDGINDESFQSNVDTLGPAAFALVNSLPRILTQFILCAEIVRGLESKAAAASLIIATSIPGVTQLVVSWIFRLRGPVGEVEAQANA